MFRTLCLNLVVWAANRARFGSPSTLADDFLLRSDGGHTVAVVTSRFSWYANYLQEALQQALLMRDKMVHALADIEGCSRTARSVRSNTCCDLRVLLRSRTHRSGFWQLKARRWALCWGVDNRATGIVYIVGAFGLWRERKWAWWLCVVTNIFPALLILASIVSGDDDPDNWSAIVFFLIPAALLLLTRVRTKGK